MKQKRTLRTSKNNRRSKRRGILAIFRNQNFIFGAFILLFGGIGVLALISSRAQTPSIHCPLDSIRFSSWQPRESDKWQTNSKHWGVDINEWGSGSTGGAAQGAPIRATINGTIKTVGVRNESSGNYVELVGPGGKPAYRFLHMRDTPLVKQGQSVKAGQIMGYVGRTSAETVHLHFDYRVDGTNTKNRTNAPDPVPMLRNCYRGQETSPNTCPHRPPSNGSRGTHILRLGQELKKGEYLISQDKKNWLIMQTDGNLVLWNQCGPDWNTATNKTSAFKLVFQREDGNLVLRNERGNYHYWFSDTQGKGAAMLAVLNSSAQEQGKIVVYKGDEQTAVWSSKKGDTKLYYGGVRATNDPGAGY